MSKIVECDMKGDAVKIHNPQHLGLPLSTQLPAKMLYAVDYALRELLMRDDADVVLERSEGGTGMRMWRCRYGGIHGWSVTPWGALQDLGEKLMKRAVHKTVESEQ